MSLCKSLKHKWLTGYGTLFAMLLLAISLNVAAEEGDSAKQVEFGIFLTNLYDINLNKNQFNIQFWAWFLHSYPDYEPTKRTELMNAKSWTTQNAFRDQQDDVIWDVVNYRATMTQQWDVSFYPFDTQTLEISLEDIEETTAGVKFVPDVEGSKIADNLIPDGWVLKKFDIHVAPNRYQTAFGDPSLKKDQSSDFSRITVALTIQRDGERLFATNFIGFFVANILVLVTLSINSSRRAHNVVPLQPRVTLSSGSIFATIGSIYMLSKELPYTTEFTLADCLLTTTCLGIALAILTSVATDVISKIADKFPIYTFNKFILLAFCLAHIGFNGAYIVSM